MGSLPFAGWLLDESAYVTFEKVGTTTKKLVTDGTVEGDAVSFTIPVPAPEYADDIVVKVFDGEDSQLTLKSSSGTDYTENGFAYSVKTYAQNKNTFISKVICARRQHPCRSVRKPYLR